MGISFPFQYTQLFIVFNYQNHFSISLPQFWVDNYNNYQHFNYLNNFMKSKGQNERINQIISLTQNYKIHRNNLDKIKPFVDSHNKKRQNQYEKIANQRLKYRQAIRDFEKGNLGRENTKIVHRLTQIVQKQDNKRYSQISTYQSPNNDEGLQSSKSNKRLKSVSSSKSFTSVSSNFRRRTLRQKQIDRENIKIAMRISNPKNSKTLILSELKRSYEKQQAIVKTRSRFSQKNQQIVKTLALQGLKFDKKDMQYLPQLSYRRGTSRMSKSISHEKIN